MPTPQIELRDVTKENWLECINLKLKPHQDGFISSNLFSLAQSRYEPCRVPCAIYNDQNQMIGFIMYNDEPLEDDGTYRISRLMIDKAYQGNGYGRAAALEAIERLRDVPDCQEIVLNYASDNEAAATFWKSLGFVVFSQYDNLHLVAKLRLT